MGAATRPTCRTQVSQATCPELLRETYGAAAGPTLILSHLLTLRLYFYICINFLIFLPVQYIDTTFFTTWAYFISLLLVE